MRSGYENGYEVITLKDCVAATSVDEHENALNYDFPMFSKPMTSGGVHRPARELTAAPATTSIGSSPDFGSSPGPATVKLPESAELPID